MPLLYQKNSYSHSAGFVLHHTIGLGANESTLDYPHTTIHPMLIYFLHGVGTIKIEGNRYDLSEGDAVLLNPGELFHCTVDDEVYHERIVLYFHEAFFQRLPIDTTGLFDPFYNRKKGFGNRISASTLKSSNLSANLIQLLKLVKKHDTSSNLQCFSIVLQSLVSLNQSIPETQMNAESHIDSVLAYINAHVAESISIGQIAAEFGMNQSYLSHLFKDRVGMSLWNYVILRRLHRFNDLLQKGRAIEQSCYEVGFQNYSNFFRLYKKHMGITPMQYKKQIQK